MLDRINTQEVLNAFAKEVIAQARRNKLSGAAQSLTADVSVNPNSINLNFEGDAHIPFLDQGVRGKKSSRKAPNSPYKFGSGNFKGTGRQFEESIAIWIKKRGLRLRDEDGKFKKGGRKTLNFLIRRSIYNKGLRPTLFFTKAFNQYFPLLPDELAEAYGLDAEQLIETTFKDHLK